MTNPLYPATNSTGWIELFNGHPVDAAWAVYTGTIGTGIIVGVLFLVFQALVVMKTRNYTYAVTLGLIFLALSGGFQLAFGSIVAPITNVIAIIMIFEIGGMFYNWFFS